MYIRLFNSVIVMVCNNSQNVGQVDTLSLRHGSRSVDKYNLRTSITTNTGATGGQRSALHYSRAQAWVPVNWKVTTHRLVVIKECLD